MDLHELSLRPHQQAFVERFVGACEADDRIVAAFLGGSYAKTYADAYSDIDLCAITTDESFDAFRLELESFLRSLGELVFLEGFGHDHAAFYIFAEDTEGELNYYRESQLDEIHAGPYYSLVDKRNILQGREFPEHVPDSAAQLERLRGHIQTFWHELSHFVTAMQRDQIWWAQGQLEALRAICVNLARLEHHILDEEAGEEAYFKIDKAMPVGRLSPLKETFVPMEKEEMLDAVRAIVRFYLEIAPPLAHKHGVRYSAELERVILARFQGLQDAM